MKNGYRHKKQRNTCFLPWHKPWAESVWLGYSVWPLCRPSQERSPEPNSDTLHLSVEETEKTEVPYESNYIVENVDYSLQQHNTKKICKKNLYNSQQ